MRISLLYNRKKVSLPVRKAGFFRKGLGLTFRTKNTESLLFDFERYVTWQGTLTSFFVFFPFLTLWLDHKNKVLDFRIVKPFVFSIKQNRKFSKIVEIPLNNKNFAIIKKFVGSSELKRYFRR